MASAQAQTLVPSKTKHGATPEWDWEMDRNKSNTLRYDGKNVYYPHGDVDAVRQRHDEYEMLLKLKILERWGSPLAAYRALKAQIGSAANYLAITELVPVVKRSFGLQWIADDDLVAVLRRWDTTDSSTIVWDEFCCALNDEPISTTIQKPDVVNGDFIQYVVGVLKRRIVETWPNLHTAFLEFDKNRNGFINKSEWQRILNERLGWLCMGIQLSAEQIEQIRLCFDPENTGKITYQQFCELVQGDSQQYARDPQFATTQDGRQLFRTASQSSPNKSATVRTANETYSRISPLRIV